MRLEKDLKRSIRRHHKERYQVRAFDKAMRWWHGSEPIDEHREWAKAWARKQGDQITSCSCFMCGNPRRHFGGGDFYRLTLQEYRYLEDEMNQRYEEGI